MKSAKAVSVCVRFAMMTMLVACSSDVTSAGSGVAEAIVTSRTLSTQTQGTKFTVTAYAVDQNLQRMPGILVATSAGPAVAVDSTVYVHELLETRVFASAAQKTATGTVITVTGHGLTKDVLVMIN